MLTVYYSTLIIFVLAIGKLTKNIMYKLELRLNLNDTISYYKMLKIIIKNYLEQSWINQLVDK